MSDSALRKVSLDRICAAAAQARFERHLAGEQPDARGKIRTRPRSPEKLELLRRAATARMQSNPPFMKDGRIVFPLIVS